MNARLRNALLGPALAVLVAQAAHAQVPPSPAEVAAYTGLHAAAAADDGARVRELIAAGADPDGRDPRGRTPLHVAAFAGAHDAMRALAAGGADVDALEDDRYDVVTIAAVADDAATLAVALEIGASASNVTSIYDGTALIAAAHLGHARVVAMLVDAGAPLDHVNNLGWTAVIEAIVLGDGGPRHQRTLRVLVDAGADLDLPDGGGATPLSLARARGFREMAAMLEAAGARP